MHDRKLPTNELNIPFTQIRHFNA